MRLAHALPEKIERAEDEGPREPAAIGQELPAIIEDIDFPQDNDVFLFYNVNNAVVGWAPTGEIVEEPKSLAMATQTEQGRTWHIAFSLDTVSKRVPRFTIPIKLREGLVEDE